MVSKSTLELYSKFIKEKTPLRIKSISGDPTPFLDTVGKMVSEANGVLRHYYEIDPVIDENSLNIKSIPSFKLLAMAGIKLPAQENRHYVRILYEIDRVVNRYSTLDVPMDWVEMVAI